MWMQLSHYACSLSVRGKEISKLLKVSGHAYIEIVERVFVPRLNSSNRRLWNGRCWRKADVGRNCHVR
jgi:hypothetical protein